MKLQCLILAGGYGKRMGEDKSRLSYQQDGQNQVAYLSNLAHQWGLTAFLSCRENQFEKDFCPDLPRIFDQSEKGGPLVGILSAMEKDPDSSWFCLACDLPLIEKKHGDILLEKYKELLEEKVQAIAFFNEERKAYEPLFAIYYPNLVKKAKELLQRDIKCPQKLLQESLVFKISLNTQSFLFNANTQEERKKILQEKGL